MTGPAIETEGLGRSQLTTCCGKPVGCTMTKEQGCRFPDHHWKRARNGDPNVRCQKTWLTPDDRPQRCALNNGHDDECRPRG